MTGRRRRFFRGDPSTHVDEEIRTHLAERIDDLVESGVAEPAARRQAHLEFGNRALALEDSRAVWSWRALRDRRIQDVRRAWRTLTKHPGFSAAVVMSVALGIGANTAIFSILNSLVFKPLPIPRADRLVLLTPGGTFASWTHPLWEQFRDRQTVLDGVIAWSVRGADFELARDGSIPRANGLWVSARFFEVLGVEPILGRTFVAADDRPGGGPDGPVAVISHRFWQRHFSGAATAVGSALSLEGVSFTVVGVAPPAFAGPEVGSSFDVAVPIGTQPLILRRNRLHDGNWWWLTVMGRLAPGQTPQAAAAALAPLQHALRQLTMPVDVRPDVSAAYLGTPLAVSPAPGGRSSLRDSYEPALATLMGIVGLILLIACVNVANLLLARAERRRHEVSLQLALGASRARLVCESLVESLLLSALGAVVGQGIATAASQWLVAQMPVAGGAPWLDLSPDWRVLGFTTAVAIAVALLFGTMPALYATSVHPLQAMGKGPRAAGLGRGRLGGALVAFQVALCLVLVVGAGLFVGTFTALTRQDAGVDRDRVLVVNVDPRRSAMASPERSQALFDRILAAVRSVPGVAEASFSSVTPVSHNTWDTAIENPSGLSLSERERQVYKNTVSPRWFATYGIPFTAGRDFSVLDQTTIPAVAIVNEAFVRRYFGGVNPIGQVIREEDASTVSMPALTIVGIVKDAVYVSLREGPTPTLYLPALSAPSVSVRAASGSPAELSTAVRAALTGVDRDLGLTIRPLADDFAAFVARERILALLAGSFGLLALLLSAIGLYGVVSYGVGARRVEIGIRIALGATPAAVVGLVVRRVAVLVGIGVVVGVPVSLWSARSVSALLFGLRPSDPWTYVSAVVVLVAVGIAAASLPASRAASMNPARTLRAE